MIGKNVPNFRNKVAKTVT
jgi:hypothetical protein